MEIQIAPADEVWRKQGRPVTEVPAVVMEALAATYRTGEVGRVEWGDGDAGDGLDFLRYARYAERHEGAMKGKRFLTQPQKRAAILAEGGFSFRVVDKVGKGGRYGQQ